MEKKKIQTEPKKKIKEICEMNIGEILLRSIDKDGSGQGLDFNLLNFIPDDSLKNVILSGGIGNILHIENGLKHKNVNAVCTGNLFNFINDELKINNQTLHSTICFLMASTIFLCNESDRERFLTIESKI